MNKNYFKNITILCIFILLPFLPILTINRAKGMISKNENKCLAGFPQIFNADGNFASGIKSGFENWLNDNIGFRDLFVKLYTNINYWILKKSPNDKVEIGQDGWFFYTMDNNLRIADGTYPLSLEILEKIKIHQENLQEYFNQQGIEYVLILPPSKVRIYPEHIKEWELYGQRKSR